MVARKENMMERHLERSSVVTKGSYLVLQMVTLKDTSKVTPMEILREKMMELYLAIQWVLETASLMDIEKEST